MSLALIRLTTLEEIPITGRSLFVGRTQRKVDLCLIGEGVDEVHCELAADPHGIRIESFSPNGVMVNGQAISSALLFTNDRLSIGSFEFRVERAGSDAMRPIRRLPTTLHSEAMAPFEDADDETRFMPPTISKVIPSSPDPRSDDAFSSGLSSAGPWLVKFGSVEFGPMDWSEIADMLERGELQPSDSMCREGEYDWRPIRSLSLAEREEPQPHRRPAPTNGLSVGTCPSAGARSAASFNSTGDVSDVRRSNGDSMLGQSPDARLSATAIVAEPQYFIQRRSGEDGPLPRHAVQELVASGALTPDTPVRLEWNTRWSNAVDLGFAYPDGISDSLGAASPDIAASASASAMPVTSAVPRGGSVRWGLMAPFFYARSAFYSIRSLSLKQLVALLLVLGVAGFAAKTLMNQRARTALTGTVLLDQQPLGEVVVTFTGMQSGEVAAAVADSQGRFRLLTISGRLSPGPYRITVRPQAGPGTTVPNGDRKRAVPEHYRLLATTDVTVDVTTEQADYEVLLSRMRRL